ncbi:hypothetical protein JAAARDRAFT_136908 [Jaapia argillacea MUCL 33604]|uniref:Phosphomevalonate kinase n=1 Tax=Jaapia argillacea MUCL 33604 TaxID=933084 RepID=A0A067PI40_9AGAM|nr:hypothetical protein JAAARDRAFT_136908 [Jaapia argillacea MUCL 33604]
MAVPTIVSSPGKVLLAGGYLVLDPSYSGIVVSTSSRFYTAIRDGTVNPRGSISDLSLIQVRSPQFLDAVWTYSVQRDENSVRVEPVADNASSSSTKNKFVQLAVQRTLSLALETKGSPALREAISKGLDIVIVGDNDFYSQRSQLERLGLPPTFDSLSNLRPFCPTGVHLPEVHKTGLGSSAALITSLISALLVHIGVVPKEEFSQDGDVSFSGGRRLAHNLSQYVHCLAQGKVGSGFDVASAVFGSQLYTRFRPEVLKDLMTDEPLPSVSLLSIISPSNRAWDYRIEPFKLPPFTRLMLADVDAGSDTPSLVGKVLKWRQADQAGAHVLWESLNQFNQSFASALNRLSELHERDPGGYTSIVKYVASLQPVQWLANPSIPESDRQIIEVFAEANYFSENIRAKMREMGKLSGVPIEPPEQTALLDVCVSQAGVIAGGVPGAGGYDAIWLLVCDPPYSPSSLPGTPTKTSFSEKQTPLHRVERVWTTWKGLSVSPLSAVESTAKGVKVIEDVNEVFGLREAIGG